MTIRDYIKFRVLNIDMKLDNFSILKKLNDIYNKGNQMGVCDRKIKNIIDDVIREKILDNTNKLKDLM